MPKSSPPALPARLWRTIAIIVVVGVAYWYQEKFLGGAEAFELERQTSAEGIPREKNTSQASEKPEKASPKPSKGAKDDVQKVNGYDRLTGCRLVKHDNNDGDSFWVQHGDRKFELRLYYVDTAEKYLSDRYADQRRRVGEQARDFGGLSIDQTVELGKAAKLYTTRLLEGKTFTVYTKWERVYNGERFYGWVVLPGSEDEEYLSERLIDKGIARIHTKGESSPDGMTKGQYKAHLEKLEDRAQEADRGAWGLD